jgi:hypothetical protein
MKPKARLNLYAIFHLNLWYSSIDEERHPDVIRLCYWPLLRLAREHGLPLGIEAAAGTLERAAAIDPSWVNELRRLTTEGPVEFVGSGYAQIIGPLVPAGVNAANLRIGNSVYERLLGYRPKVALVNEQAYSAGMVGHYRDAGYEAIVMEWDNPARFHPEWDPEWRYHPQYACGQHGERLPLLWNSSIAFQKFQRAVHGDIDEDEYFDFLGSHASSGERVFSLYGNDAEVFNFRPGRYRTEKKIEARDEWEKIGDLLKKVRADRRFGIVPPSDALEFISSPAGGQALRLESPQLPIPVKKQGKYNVTRWAVTGRDDLGINTSCWRIFKSLEDHGGSAGEWKELCHLWSSDYRTHVTGKRWEQYLARLRKAEQRAPHGEGEPPRSRRASSPDGGEGRRAARGGLTSRREGRILSVESESLEARLTPLRGLAVESLRFKSVSQRPLLGTVRHGYYSDIDWGADFYTGHLVLESPGKAKITDLNETEYSASPSEDNSRLVVTGEVPTELGAVRKTLIFYAWEPRVDISFELDRVTIPASSLRVGHVTLLPDAFDASSIFFRTHNGGRDPETFTLHGLGVNHGRPVSPLVSASCALGMTDGYVDIGDGSIFLRLSVDRTRSALAGFVHFEKIGDSYFCRVSFSAGESDETTVSGPDKAQDKRICFHLSVTAFSQ